MYVYLALLPFVELKLKQITKGISLHLLLLICRNMDSRHSLQVQSSDDTSQQSVEESGEQETHQGCQLCCCEFS